jgi:hypothetical protein
LPTRRWCGEARRRVTPVSYRPRPTDCGKTSNAPQRSNSSMCSRDSKMKRSSIRVPASCLVSRTRTAVVGISAFGVPSSCANPSVNSSDLGGSTRVTRHQPRDFSPPGPVMTSETSPPADRSCFSTVQERRPQSDGRRLAARPGCAARAYQRRGWLGLTARRRTLRGCRPLRCRTAGSRPWTSSSTPTPRPPRPHPLRVSTMITLETTKPREPECAALLESIGRKRKKRQVREPEAAQD